MPSGPPIAVHVTYSQQYRRCRKAGCTQCGPDKPGHGPYWFAYWRDDGRLRSRYLGKQAPPGAAQPGPNPRATTKSGARPRLSVRTLGAFVVSLDDKPFPATVWRRRPVLALFTCLLSAQGHRIHREKLIDALWPEAELSTATRELHRTLHALREILGQTNVGRSALRHEGEMIVLEPIGAEPHEAEWLDADVFGRKALAALRGTDPSPCREAMALYGGDYLPDDPYSEWVVVRREQLQAQYVALLLHLAQLSGAMGDLAESEQCLRTVLQQDSCQEDAAAALMGMLASAGRRIEALRVYQVLVTALDTALGLVPGSEIEALRGRLQALEAAPAAAHLPPKAGVTGEAGNLPASLTSFVGRAWEQGEIVELLASTRLVTLTGPGGCGKTRLALETAGRLHGRYPDGAWLIELAALQETALVPEAIAAALGILEEMKGLAGAALVAALCAFLQPRRILLVLDNCEHLIGACAALAVAMLRGCPNLTILATSREALGVVGETTWHVPPLATPAGNELLPSKLMDYEAVQLFVDRARASRPGFILSTSNAFAVLQICRRLDGLPLALELAAARLGTLSVEGIASRLNDCFALLTGGNRTALPRQQTLRATMDWSFGLLSVKEQIMLRRLSVFAGGWTLEAAVAVCGDEAGEEPTRIAQELLDELASRSMILIAERDGVPRFRLLETMRQYAHGQLVASGEIEQIQTRHRLWYLDQLSQAGAAARTKMHSIWLDRLEADLDNLRVALDLSSRHPINREELLPRAESIAQLCLVRGHIQEGTRWLAAALAENCGGMSQARANALNAAGTLASELGDYGQAISLYEEGLAVFSALGDTRGSARVLINEGNVMKYLGEQARARDLFEAGCRRAREHGDPALLAIALNNVGTLAIELGDTEWAARVLEESLALKRQSGSQAGIIQVLVNLGEVARARHDLPRAGTRYEEALALAQLLGDRPHIALVHYNLGLVAAAGHSADQAAAEFRESLHQEQELGNKRQIAANLEGLAGIAVIYGHADQAGRLLGAAEYLREQIGAPIPEVDRAVHEDNLAKARAAAISSAVAKSAWDQGRAMNLDAAIAEALSIGVVAGA